MDRLQLESRSGRRDHGLKGKRRGAHKVTALKKEAEELRAAGNTSEADEKLKEAEKIEKRLIAYRKKFMSHDGQILMPVDARDSQGHFYPDWYATEKVEKPHGHIIQWHVAEKRDHIDLEDVGPAAKVFYEYEESRGTRDVGVICGREVGDTPSGSVTTCGCFSTSTSTVSWGTKQIGEDQGMAGDLGSSANEAIELMIHRDIDYKPKFIEWAQQMHDNLVDVMNKMKMVLKPCDAIVVVSTVELDHNKIAKDSYGQLIWRLDDIKSKIDSVLANSMGDSETARKNFNLARDSFNDAQQSYRQVGDIGQTAMFDYADQLMHIMAQVMDTMGRGFATGHVPKEPGPPQLHAVYPGQMSDEETRLEVEALTDRERPILTDGARAWMEPYLFMTCNAAHAIRSSMRLWGCMVEPNFDGGLDHDVDPCPDGGGKIGFVRMSGMKKNGELRVPSLESVADKKEYMEGIRGELLNHYISADAGFGGVEGNMRNMAQHLRVNWDSEDNDTTNFGQGTLLAQWAAARAQFADAQKHARYMADVGLNQQTLNIYDLIRIQEDNFRAIGRALYSGSPAPSPPQYSELSYTVLTPSERNMVDNMRSKLEAGGKATALEVSHVARMCCDLGHFCQGLAQRNILTHNTPTQDNLEGINGNAGNIETASRKIMCLVDSRKDRVCWPTEVKNQLIVTRGLFNAIKADLDKAMNPEQAGHYGMTELPELVGFGQAASCMTKGDAIQKAIDQGNELLDLQRLAIKTHPYTIVPCESVTPVTIKPFRDDFKYYVQAADPATATNQGPAGEDLFQVACVNVLHHRIFDRKAKIPLTRGVFRKVIDETSVGPDGKVRTSVKLINLGRGDLGNGKTMFKPLDFEDGYHLGYDDAKQGTPINPDTSRAGPRAIPIWDNKCDSNGISSQQMRQQAGVLWQEVEWKDGTFSYMSHFGSWLHVEPVGRSECNSGLTLEGRNHGDDTYSANFKIEKEIEPISTGACHHCGEPDSRQHHIQIHGHDDGAY